MIVFNKSPVSFVNLNNKLYFNDNKIKPQQKPLFEKIIENLEQFHMCQFGDIPLNYGIDDRLLPSVGSTIPVQYKINTDQDAKIVEWQVLGYNKSIPQRIKYKNGNLRIYVTTIGSDGLLATISSGTDVYADKTSSTPIGTVTEVSDNIAICPGNTVDNNNHTYGNNYPYDAPATLVYDGKTWEFAGWNITIQSKYGLSVGAIVSSVDWLMQITCFDGLHDTTTSKLKNRWAISTIRQWLNTDTVVDASAWYYIDGDTSKRFSKFFKGMLSRLPESSFLDAIIPTVNRTWVYSSFRTGLTLDDNYCEHVVDNFWLLGAGHVGLGAAAASQFPDISYDTSKFADVFVPTNKGMVNSTRIRTVMDANGGYSGLNPGQFLRSASADGYNLVALISQGGDVTHYDTNVRLGVAPACVLG